MRRTSLTILSVLISLSTALGECISKGEASLLISRILKVPTVVKEVKEIKEFNACMAKTESGETFFISRDKREIIEGILIKVPTPKLTEREIKVIKERALFSVGIGEPLIVITNPLCRVCRKNRRELFKLSRKFKVYIVPVGFSGKEFLSSVDAYCRKKGLRDFFKEDEFKVCSEGKLKVWTVSRILKEKGLTATPLFILPKGKVLIGEEGLKELLKL